MSTSKVGGLMWRPLTHQSDLTAPLRPRSAGLLYLLGTLGLWLGEGAISYLLIDNSISATAANVLKHRTVYSTAFAFNALSVVCMAAALPLLREIVRPVNERLARLAVTYGLVGCAVQTILNVFLYAAQSLINGTPYRDAFRPVEFQAIAHLCMSIFSTGILVALMFFGLSASILGYLIVRSTFLPRALGVVLAISGFSWAIVAFPGVLEPIGGVGILAGLIGQTLLGLWLLAKGVNKDRWNEMAERGEHDDQPDGPPDRPGVELPMIAALPLSSENITSRPKLMS